MSERFDDVPEAVLRRLQEKDRKLERKRARERKSEQREATFPPRRVRPERSAAWVSSR
jgi:hypothetical protein